MRGLIFHCQFQWWLPVVQPWQPLVMPCVWHEPVLSWLIRCCYNDLIEAELRREFQAKIYCPHSDCGRATLRCSLFAKPGILQFKAGYYCRHPIMWKGLQVNSLSWSQTGRKQAAFPVACEHYKTQASFHLGHSGSKNLIICSSEIIFNRSPAYLILVALLLCI